MPDGRRLLVWSGEHYHHGNVLGLVPGAVSSFQTDDDCDAEMLYNDPWGVACRRIPRYLEKLEAAGYRPTPVRLEMRRNLRRKLEAGRLEEAETFLREHSRRRLAPRRVRDR